MNSARYSNQRGGSVFLICALLSIAGCKCSNPAAQRQEDLDRLPQAAGSLQDQLAAEVAARTGDTVTLEALLASLTKEGITFNAPRQAFGKKLLAIYCASADATDGMIVTVCEYPSPEQAQRGAQEASAMGKMVTGYQSRVKKKSVLQVVQPSTTPPEHVAKLLSTFDAL